MENRVGIKDHRLQKTISQRCLLKIFTKHILKCVAEKDPHTHHNNIFKELFSNLESCSILDKKCQVSDLFGPVFILSA